MLSKSVLVLTIASRQLTLAVLVKSKGDCPLVEADMSIVSNAAIPMARP
jgi:hypothetical protein